MDGGGELLGTQSMDADKNAAVPASFGNKIPAMYIVASHFIKMKEHKFFVTV
jgi:hypothetical protein